MCQAVRHELGTHRLLQRRGQAAGPRQLSSYSDAEIITNVILPYLDRFDRRQQHVSLWPWGVAFGASVMWLYVRRWT